VGGFENGVAGNVIDISAGRDADAANLRSEGVTQVIAVEVQGRNDVKLFRAREHLLKCDIGNGIFDDNSSAGFASGILHHGPPSISTAPKNFFATS